MKQTPDSVTSVDVVVAPDTRAVTVRRTLGADAARSLARLVNDLPTVSPAGHSCPIYLQGFTDVLTFRGAGLPVVVTVDVGGCPSVQVGPSSADTPVLDAGGVDAAVLKAPGLPADYGR